MQLQLTGKVALVTGSSRGTGEMIARQLSAEGATVIAHGLTQGSAEHLLDSGAHYSTWGDIRNREGCRQLVSQVRTRVPQLDILVNNYGTADSGTWDSATDEDWLDSYQVNVLSAVRLIREFSSGMRQQGWGRIILLGTIGSLRPNAVRPHYYAAKAALANLTVSLAKQLGGSGITVNAVSPGLVRTAEVEAAFREKAERHNWPEKEWPSIEQRVIAERFPNPVGRMAQREEVADLVCFLASQRAAYINGQNIRIDGGAVDLAL